MASLALVGLATGRNSWSMPNALVQNVARAANWTPTFLNAHQDATVTVLADLIIPDTDTPGAKQAKVNRYVDLFLSVKNPADQKQFVDGLNSLDSNPSKKVFVDCSEAEQVAILNQISGSAFFQQAKGMISGIYFATPEGYHDLNKLGIPKNALACDHSA